MMITSLEKNWSDPRHAACQDRCQILGTVVRQSRFRAAIDERLGRRARNRCEVTVSFMLPCPNCGPRDVYEFGFGGETSARPQPDASDDVWNRYLYFRSNEAGVQEEWWYHRWGCQAWFLALRDTRTNSVVDVPRLGAPAR